MPNSHSFIGAAFVAAALFALAPLPAGAQSGAGIPGNQTHTGGARSADTVRAGPATAQSSRNPAQNPALGASDPSPITRGSGSQGLGRNNPGAGAAADTRSGSAPTDTERGSRASQSGDSRRSDRGSAIAGPGAPASAIRGTEGRAGGATGNPR